MRYKINLINKKEAPLSERLIYFSLNYLRYIIVFTQLVVISVFFYRFQVDQRIIDLREAVDQKKEIVQVVYPLLSQMSFVEKQITQVNMIIDNQKKFKQMIESAISPFPASLSLTKLEIEKNQIKMSGWASDIRYLQAYYYLLIEENKFEKVILENIKKLDSGYSFSLVLINFKI